MPLNPFVTFLILAGILVFVGFLVMLATRYRRCPSNKILVIYGKVGAGHSSRCLQGGGAFIWPLIQNYAYLDLDPIQIDIPLKGALSSENIRVNVPSVFTVAIGTQNEIMTNAAVRLLGLTQQEITAQARDIIFGQLRQVIASMPIEKINRDRDEFLQKIQFGLEPELNKIGLVLINVNITDITDESGYIEALGRKAASEAIMKAEVDVAEQNKIGAIGVARAQREEAIQVAQATKDRQIGTSEAEREQAVRLADLQRERLVGEKAAEYQRDAEMREREREMRISVSAADATAVEGENLAKARVAATNAELSVRQAEAYGISETKKREAEAQVLEAQYLAQAKAAEAEARRVEAEQRARLEAPARAQKARIMVDAEAEAERMKIEAEGRAQARIREAEGEAMAIYKKLEAEARGQLEILAKKGQGLREIVNACGNAEEAFRLLMLEHLDHLADKSAEAISNIKFDKITVWDGGNGDGKGGASGFLRSLGSSIPPLMDIMRNVGGVELPSYFGKLVPADESEAAPAHPAAAPTEASGDKASGKKHGKA
ncbi:MAG: flotillin family protein [Planctomycetes bacterium]|nr:flotillin family protein [Planctomycetota bacterium]